MGQQETPSRPFEPDPSRIREPWQLLGYLYGVIDRRGSISRDDWATAVAYFTDSVAE